MAQDAPTSVAAPDAFGAYLPIDRRLALADAMPAPPDRDEGVVLFLDISGFTPLTQALIQALGPDRGAEALISELNRIYELLIDLVHQFHGSAIGFSGDAITCWFSGDNGHRATTVGLLAQEAMSALDDVVVHASTGQATEDEGELLRFPLSIKVAISKGPARRFLVGAPLLMRLEVLAGQTVDHVALAEQQATRGDIVMTEATALALGALLTPTSWREAGGHRFAVIEASGRARALATRATPTPWAASREPLPPQVAEAWLPVATRKRLRVNAFLAEFRPVVALFLRFGGIDYDQDEGAGEALNAYVSWMQQIVARYGGTILQLTFGDKGSYAYASFGAPITYADNAVRAVAAALALAHPPASFAQITTPQLGLAAGSMCTGAYGSTRRRVYGVLGHKTNLAARLMMHAAPGDILCDENVMRGACGTWDFDALPAIQAKGVRGDVALFRPTGARVSAGTSGRHQARIGRDEIFATMQATLDVVGAAESASLMLEGEAGMGKSCLVGALTNEAIEREMTVLSGAGLSIEEHTPYRAWREPLLALFALHDDLSPDERRAAIHDFFALHLPEDIERMPLLNDILDVGIPETGWTQDLAAELRQESLQGLLISMLRAYAALGPLCVILEDAQWFDSLTWELLLHVARAIEVSLHGLLLLVTMRPRTSQASEAPNASYHQALAALSRQLSTQLSLPPMPANELDALVAFDLGCEVSALPAGLSQLLRLRAGGNPFFALELLRLLREKELLQQQGTRWTLRKGAGTLAKLPDSIEGLLLARIDQLPPQRQQILKVASVIGQQFPFPLLHHSLQHRHSSAPDALRAQLSRLVDDSFAVQEGDASEYAFANITTRDVAYRTLLYQQRRELHHTIARWYEQSPLDAASDASTGAGGEATAPGAKATDDALSLVPSSHWPLLVYHWHHAQVHEKERHWARRAGEQAASQHAHAEANTYLSRALVLTPLADVTARYELLLMREQVYEHSGDHDAQREDLAAMRALASELPPEAQIQIRLREAHFAMLTASYEAALSAAEDAHEQAEALGASALQANALHLSGDIFFKQRDVEAARVRFQASLDVAQAHQLSSLEALSLNALGKCYWRQGALEEGRTLLEQALAQFRALADLRSEALVLNNIALVLGHQGRRAEAANTLQEARSTCATLGDRRGEALVLGNLGMGALEIGAYLDAQTYLERALVLTREVGARDNEALALIQLGDLHKRGGNYAEARTHTQHALELYEAIGHPFFTRIARMVLAECAHYTGGHSAAVTQMQAALADGAAELDPSLAAEMSVLLARAFVALEQYTEALAALDTARPWLEGGDPKVTLHHQATEAFVRYQLGEGEAATALVDALLPSILPPTTDQGNVEIAGEGSESADVTGVDVTGMIDGFVEPFEIYLAVLRTLAGSAHPLLTTLQETAQTLLQHRAGLLDAPRRETFLSQVPHHRALLLLVGDLSA